MTRPLLVLVGPPGAGKTTVGTVVAARRQVEFRDTDGDVERLAGSTVAEIFLESGEEKFRQLERQAVARALAEHSGVLALGGGAVLDADTRALLRGGHHVVFLDVGPAQAAARVGFNRDRPLLLGNPRRRLQELLEARRPLYVEVATVTVNTEERTPEQVADDVLATLA